MPRKHKEPKPRNIKKIKRKREKRKAEKNQINKIKTEGQSIKEKNKWQ